MLDYESLEKILKQNGIDPFKRGDNFRVNSVLLHTYETPFNLDLIDFPEKEKNQVLRIGEILNNLISCKRRPGSLDGNYKKENKLNELISLLEKSLDYWFDVGMRKCKQKKDLVCHNGFVYEINPEYYKKMDEMNRRMEEVRRDFRNKVAHSEIEAENIILV